MSTITVPPSQTYIYENQHNKTNFILGQGSKLILKNCTVGSIKGPGNVQIQGNCSVTGDMDVSGTHFG